MKKALLIILLLVVLHTLFSQTNVSEYYYANGNGTIITKTIENGYEITIRKHEQRFPVHPYGKISVYENWYSHQSLFELTDGDFVTTSQVAFIKKVSAEEAFNWVKITDDQGRISWLNMNHPVDPYRDGNGAFLETIVSGSRTWTVIRLQGGLSYFETINVYEKPGSDSVVLFQLLNEDGDQLSIEYSAITKETDDYSQQNPWVKITDNQGKTGWMFGGDGSTERGGPKYYFPENMIGFYFNLP
jgi:uncharacterized protein YxeA